MARIAHHLRAGGGGNLRGAVGRSSFHDDDFGGVVAALPHHHAHGGSLVAGGDDGGDVGIGLLVCVLQISGVDPAITQQAARAPHYKHALVLAEPEDLVLVIHGSEYRGTEWRVDQSGRILSLIHI